MDEALLDLLFGENRNGVVHVDDTNHFVNEAPGTPTRVYVCSTCGWTNTD